MRANGRWWRAKRGIMLNPDKLKVHRQLTGKRAAKLDVAEQTLEAHADELAQLIAERGPIPDPPGLELVGRAKA
jgi:hypothetical protein